MNEHHYCNDDDDFVVFNVLQVTNKQFTLNYISWYDVAVHITILKLIKK